MNIDAYTILYHTKENITADKIRLFLVGNKGIDEEAIVSNMEEYMPVIRELSALCLQNGIKEVERELPPSVSRRMNKYYQQNQDTLIDAFCMKLKTEILKDLY